MKNATPLTPPGIDLRYSILNTKCIAVIYPEGPEKYNSSEMNGVTFYDRQVMDDEQGCAKSDTMK